ncbi:MAG: calcium/sodium antiporter [Spirochaetes bacterium]|nr:calcium/sodium antiporter [Spirochaetota bacterium]
MEALGAIALLLAGFAALYFGADWLVRGSVALALRLGIPPVIVGLTIVAFGTSSPELLVSFNAGRMGNADIAIGNVIGSNIANIALILGAAALIRPIVLNLRAVRFDVIFMLAVSILFTVMVLDRDLERPDGLLFLAGMAFYIVYKVRQAMCKMREGRPDVLGSGVEEIEEKARTLSAGRSVLLVVLGIAVLVGGSELFIRGAVTLARMLGVSNVVIGLTVVAFGTSLPELATSVLAAAKGEGDVSLGNVVGSNIFNILFILGATATVFPIGTGDLSLVDLLVMLGTSILIIPISLIGGRVTRPEAAVLLGLYGGYVYYLYAMHAAGA